VALCNRHSPTKHTSELYPFAELLHAHHAYLGDFDVDPETRRVLSAALEMTRIARGLADHYANGIIAKQIIELAKAGERDPNLLREGAIEKLREHWFGD
jgi:hypothetical protein